MSIAPFRPRLEPPGCCSFTVETDGRLPSEQSPEQVDSATDGAGFLLHDQLRAP